LVKADPQRIQEDSRQKEEKEGTNLPTEQRTEKGNGRGEKELFWVINA